MKIIDIFQKGKSKEEANKQTKNKIEGNYIFNFETKEAIFIINKDYHNQISIN